MKNFKFSKYSYTLLLFVQDSASSQSRTFRFVTYPEARLVTQEYFASLTLKEKERLKPLQSFASCTCNSHYNTTELIPTWEVNSFSTAQCICFLFWNDMDGNSGYNRQDVIGSYPKAANSTSTPSHLFGVASILMLSSHLRLGSCDLSHECYMPIHLIRLYFIMLITFGHAYKLWCTSLFSFIKPHIITRALWDFKGKGSSKIS